jgi:ferritin-like metal-binding protein YciE
METLDELFEVMLRELYDTDKHAAKAVSKLARKATSDRLAALVADQSNQHRSCAERLEKILESIGGSIKARKCDASRGMIEDAETIVGKAKDHALRDAAMVMSIVAIDHYRLSRYTTAKTWAELQGLTEPAQLLDESLRDVKEITSKFEALGSDVYRSAIDRTEFNAKSASSPRLKKCKRAEEAVAGEHA